MGDRWSEREKNQTITWKAEAYGKLKKEIFRKRECRETEEGWGAETKVHEQTKWLHIYHERVSETETRAGKCELKTIRRTDVVTFVECWTWTLCTYVQFSPIKCSRRLSSKKNRGAESNGIGCTASRVEGETERNRAGEEVKGCSFIVLLEYVETADTDQMTVNHMINACWGRVLNRSKEPGGIQPRLLAMEQCVIIFPAPLRGV